MNKTVPVMASLIALLAAAFWNLAMAALPPQYQNANDLNALVAFVKKYPRVAGTIKSIDVQNHVVYFDVDCKAEFARQKIDRPPGWAGPAAPLEFVRSNCKLD